MSFSPIYPPFLAAPGLQGRSVVDVPLKPTNGAGTEFEIDFEALEAAMVEPATASTIPSMPTAARPRLPACCCCAIPTTRSAALFTREELDRLADFCEKHDSTSVRTKCTAT